MKSLLEVWRSAEGLAAPQLVPVLRRFSLACMEAALGELGVADPDVAERLRERALDPFLRDDDTWNFYDMTANVTLPGGLRVICKAFKGESFQPFERVALRKGKAPWVAALRIHIEPGADGQGSYRIGDVYAGLLHWDMPAPSAAEVGRLHDSGQSACGGEFAIQHLSPDACGEAHMIGTCWHAAEWTGSEAELAAQVGRLLARVCTVWDTTEVGSGGEEVAPISMDMSEALVQRLQQRGYRFTREQLATFYGALKAKGFVILSGLSGTGKTRLAQEFAAALGLEHDHFLLEPVRPDWRDSTGLLGYWNPVAAKYEVTQFLKFVLAAEQEYQLCGAQPQDSGVELTPGGVDEWIRGVLRDRGTQAQIGRYEEFLKGVQSWRSQKLSLWLEHHLEQLWRLGDNGVADVGGRGLAYISDDTLLEATAALADTTRPLATRATTALSKLTSAGATPPARARIVRVLAAFEPERVPPITTRKNVRRACKALGVPVSIRNEEAGRWVDLERAWQDLYAKLRQVLQRVGADVNRPALVGVIAQLLAKSSGMEAGSAEDDTDDLSLSDPAVKPYLVVLDEMNLARVEYYLADLLSVLESGRDGAGYTRGVVTLHSQPQPIQVGDGPGIPATLRLPPNLYIIGTVNMDETTFAFSPKVLDRAFTLEFRNIDLSEYPPAPAPDQGGDDGLDAAALLADFTRQGRFARFDKQDVATWAAGRRHLIQALDELNRALVDHDLGFGYRVVDEILAFVGGVAESPVADALPEADAFDAAVLMKVLPKFHGPLHRMQAPLEAVLGWAGPKASPRYRRTYEKAERMLRRARDLGHCSFS